MNHTLLGVTLSVICLCGCREFTPTDIATINNSGRLLLGNFTVGNEQAPFAHLSSHSGLESFHGGENVNVQVTDLWSQESFSLEGTVPIRPEVNKPISLLLEIQKDLTLRISWKADSLSLRQHHVAYIQKEFDCLPILIRNEHAADDSIVRSLQEKYSFEHNRWSDLSMNDPLTYGFTLQGNIVANKIFVSLEQGEVLRTRFLELPADFKLRDPEISAIYIRLEEGKEHAQVYPLKGTNSDPLSLANDFQEGKIDVPKVAIEVKVFETTEEIRRGIIRLPDWKAIP
jgi:hypothetical protein